MSILFSNEILDSVKRELQSATSSVQIITAYCEYYVAAEPPVRCGESHLSGQTEPPCY